MEPSTNTAVRSRRVRRLAAAGCAAALVLGLVACGDDDDDDTAASGGSATTEYGNDGGSATTGSDAGGAAGGEVAYEVTEIAYTDLTAPAGSTIDINNSSGAAHTFTADDGSFDEDVASEGTTEVQAPDEAGTYDFHCEIHPSMTATLTVE